MIIIREMFQTDENSVGVITSQVPYGNEAQLTSKLEVTTCCSLL